MSGTWDRAAARMTTRRVRGDSGAPEPGEASAPLPPPRLRVIDGAAAGSPAVEIVVVTDADVPMHFSSADAYLAYKKVNLKRNVHRHAIRVAKRATKGGVSDSPSSSRRRSRSPPASVPIT